MRHAHLQIAQSSMFKELVTLRHREEDDKIEGLRQALTKAGFKPGDKVVVILLDDFDSLYEERYGDPPDASECQGCGHE